MALPAIKVMRLAEALPLEPALSELSATTSIRAGSSWSASAANWRKMEWLP
jgi:hypothetical protein